MSTDTGFVTFELEGDLPSLPAAALELLRLCQDPDAELDDLARALSRDPILASRVLRMANSAAYRRRTEVTSLQAASVMLGMRALRVVALGFTITEALPRRGVWAGLDLGEYWHRSLVNAVVARSLARAAKSPLAEEAFLCGLLADLGKLALAYSMPEGYGPVVAEGIGWPSDDLERLRLGVPACEVAEFMLREWELPELIVVGASFAARPDEVSAETAEDARALARLVGFARVGASVLFQQDPGGLVAFTAGAQQRFGLSTDDALTLIDALEAEIREESSTLSLELPAGFSYVRVQDEARALALEVLTSAPEETSATSRSVGSP